MTTLIPFASVVLSIDHIKAIIINKQLKRLRAFVKKGKRENALLTHGAVVFEGFGDLSARQVAEVRHRRRS